MRSLKLAIAFAMAAVLAFPATASAESGLKVTGGGQAFASAEDASAGGPGDTYGFNAQQIDDAAAGESAAAKGNLNIIDRDRTATTARGRGEHIRGEVTCIRALALGENEDADGVARFGGVLRERDENGDIVYFVVDVTDNGEGRDSDDAILYREVAPGEDETPCDVDRNGEDTDMVLARGNVQIHNYEAPPEEEPATGSLLDL